MSALILIAAGAMVVLGAVSIGRLRRRRRGAAAGLAGGGLVFAGVTAALIASELHLRTYREVTDEAPAGSIRFLQQGPDRYEAVLELAGEAAPRRYALAGQEWQIDARVLTWQPALRAFGLRTLYRLDRLSGRYASIEDERTRPRTVYGLSRDAGLDLWRLAREHPGWLPFADAKFGSAAYLPMAHEAAYDIAVTGSGLLARPANGAAEAAVRIW